MQSHNTPRNLLSFESGDAIAEATRVAATGISNPSKVLLTKGTSLFRLHDGAKPLGSWWFSGYEYLRIARRLQLAPSALLSSRDLGLSPLAYAFRLLPEWYNDRSDQLLRFSCITLCKDLMALYGAGRSAPRLGGNIPARQIFVPDLRFYGDAYSANTLSGISDAFLWQFVKRHGSPRLSFE